jgi:hypothetical protein
MADCRSYATTPIKVEVEGIKSTLYGGTVAKEKKTYYAQIDECKSGSMTIYDITNPAKPIAIGNSNVENEYKFNFNSGAGLSDITKKSIEQSVVSQFDSIRANDINQKDPTTIELNFKGVPGVKNTEKPEDQQARETALSYESRNKLQNEGVPPNIEDEKFDKFPAKLYYPETLGANKFQQDYIKFNVIDYKTRVFTPEGLKRFERFEKQTKNIRSEIWLPIQGGIIDNNSVNWNGDSMNAVEQAAAFASLGSQMSTDLKSEMETVKESIANLVGDKGTNTAIQSYLSAFFARMAVNSQSNFFSRGFGAILNPNLELLFQSAELRPFNFRFDLTPRSREEAKLVKQIIRVFKQSMAVRKGKADIFLKAPMVYEIAYISGKSAAPHMSIGRIKTCAMRSCVVNYTPTNQYMTFDDASSTMTAYSIDMQFQELEPVYFDDYLGIPMTEIGY